MQLMVSMPTTLNGNGGINLQDRNFKPLLEVLPLLVITMIFYFKAVKDQLHLWKI